MTVTELLVMAYDGDHVVFTTDLTAERAETILMRADPGGQVAVEATSSQANPAFAALVQTLEELTERSG